MRQGASAGPGSPRRTPVARRRPTIGLRNPNQIKAYAAPGWPPPTEPWWTCVTAVRPRASARREPSPAGSPFSPLFHRAKGAKSVECFVTARMAFAETPPGTAAWRVWQLEAAEHVATVAVEVERDALTVWCGPFDLAAPDAVFSLLEAFACLAAPDQTAPVVRELSGAQCLAFLAGVRAQCDPATTRVVDGVVNGVEVVVRGLGSDRPYAPNLLKRRKNR